MKMKIVIDIPDEEYKTLSKLSEKERVNELSYYERIIADGTPLPKGHGDLIDRDVALADFHDRCFDYEGSILKYIPTVIPADEVE